MRRGRIPPPSLSPGGHIVVACTAKPGREATFELVHIDASQTGLASGLPSRTTAMEVAGEARRTQLGPLVSCSTKDGQRHEFTIITPKQWQQRQQQQQQCFAAAAASLIAPTCRLCARAYEPKNRRGKKRRPRVLLRRFLRRVYEIDCRFIAGRNIMQLLCKQRRAAVRLLPSPNRPPLSPPKKNSEIRYGIDCHQQTSGGSGGSTPKESSLQNPARGVDRPRGFQPPWGKGRWAGEDDTSPRAAPPARPTFKDGHLPGRGGSSGRVVPADSPASRVTQNLRLVPSLPDIHCVCFADSREKQAQPVRPWTAINNNKQQIGRQHREDLLPGESDVDSHIYGRVRENGDALLGSWRHSPPSQTKERLG